MAAKTSVAVDEPAHRTLVSQANEVFQAAGSAAIRGDSFTSDATSTGQVKEACALLRAIYSATAHALEAEVEDKPASQVAQEHASIPLFEVSEQAAQAQACALLNAIYSAAAKACLLGELSQESLEELASQGDASPSLTVKRRNVHSASASSAAVSEVAPLLAMPPVPEGAARDVSLEPLQVEEDDPDVSKRWSPEASLLLCYEGEDVSRFADRACLVDRDVAASVRDAIRKLRKGKIPCDKEICVVYSARVRAYYALFEPGKRRECKKALGLEDFDDAFSESRSPKPLTSPRAWRSDGAISGCVSPFEPPPRMPNVASAVSSVTGASPRAEQAPRILPSPDAPMRSHAPTSKPATREVPTEAAALSGPDLAQESSRKLGDDSPLTPDPMLPGRVSVEETPRKHASAGKADAHQAVVEAPSAQTAPAPQPAPKFSVAEAVAPVPVPKPTTDRMQTRDGEAPLSHAPTSAFVAEAVVEAATSDSVHAPAPPRTLSNDPVTCDPVKAGLAQQASLEKAALAQVAALQLGAQEVVEVAPENAFPATELVQKLSVAEASVPAPIPAPEVIPQQTSSQDAALKFVPASEPDANEAAMEEATYDSGHAPEPSCKLSDESVPHCDPLFAGCSQRAGVEQTPQTPVAMLAIAGEAVLGHAPTSEAVAQQVVLEATIHDPMAPDAVCAGLSQQASMDEARVTHVLGLGPGSQDVYVEVASQDTAPSAQRSHKMSDAEASVPAPVPVPAAIPRQTSAEDAALNLAPTAIVAEEVVAHPVSSDHASVSEPPEAPLKMRVVVAHSMVQDSVEVSERIPPEVAAGRPVAEVLPTISDVETVASNLAPASEASCRERMVGSTDPHASTKELGDTQASATKPQADGTSEQASIDTGFMTVKIQSDDGKVITFKIKRTNPMSKATDAYLKMKRLPASRVRFLANGSPADRTQTPNELGLPDEVIVLALTLPEPDAEAAVQSTPAGSAPSAKELNASSSPTVASPVVSTRQIVAVHHTDVALIPQAADSAAAIVADAGDNIHMKMESPTLAETSVKSRSLVPVPATAKPQADAFAVPKASDPASPTKEKFGRASGDCSLLTHTVAARGPATSESVPTVPCGSILPTVVPVIDAVAQVLEPAEAQPGHATCLSSVSTTDGVLPLPAAAGQPQGPLERCRTDTSGTSSRSAAASEDWQDPTAALANVPPRLAQQALAAAAMGQSVILEEPSAVQEAPRVVSSGAPVLPDDTPMPSAPSVSAPSPTTAKGGKGGKSTVPPPVKGKGKDSVAPPVSPRHDGDEQGLSTAVTGTSHGKGKSAVPPSLKGKGKGPLPPSLVAPPS